jgi:hypothetical protein
MNETQQETQNDLLSRIELIESMVQQGRRRTEYWGWSFVLWGMAYLVAIGWSHTSVKPQIAWPVTMVAAWILTMAVASRKKRGIPNTLVSRAVGAIWIAVGAAIFIFCFAAGSSGHAEMHIFWAGIEVLLGVANCASSLILRWRAQFVVALVWWISAVAICFVSVQAIMPIVIADTLICLIGFGLYLMHREYRDRQQRELHA